MAQFDYYRFEGGYLLDVQADVLDGLNTRVVVPLLPQDKAPRPARHLNPVVRIDRRPHVMMTQWMAAIPKSELTRRAGSLAQDRDIIKPALDFLVDGF